ncbi:uncharacterized protein BDZ99DRAFT_399662 [Mytilinidion resinicola]|uniref:BTB domain-containing protein n=1 Tax=Mytilinidion resinicola TaxID=574789 RepID=A0A6A6Y419_9PEZI|nr:uncharacterized protein BDZ99DRAFT_399662 [Mytilinidion resinicola]KAF2803586.1 hypothetical protein BDZ99DRAFT_399662 [Mytilinidion resinicola]
MESRKLITLTVGERTFRTTRSTLETESKYFRAFFAEARVGGRSNYSIDNDGDTFEHVLRFMRCPSKFPIFWSKEKGHNFNLYQTLQEEAERFGVDALAEWLKAKKYLEAVKLVTKIKEVEVPTTAIVNCPEFIHEIKGSLVDVEYHPQWRRSNSKTYICPRGLDVHEGDPKKCGKQCRQVQGEKPDEYRDVWRLWLLVVQKEVVFHENVCIHGG